MTTGRKRFALDSGVAGQKVVLNNTPYTIIGVTPPEFFGLQPGERIDVSVPITMYGLVNPGFAQIGTRFDVLTAPFRPFLNVMARLKPGVTAKQASADLESIFHQSMREAAASLSGLPFDSPAMRRAFLASTLRLESGGQGLSALRQQFSKPLWILMAIVALLLLVTCANVANLLLARANARQREIAVRLTVGAGSRRLIRQLITESVLLAISGGALGLLLAFWSARSLLMLASHSSSTIYMRVQPDSAILIFTLLVSLLTALLFGLVPAWRAARPNLTATLIESTRCSGRAGTRSRLGKALIVFQVAVSLVLLIGAGLLTRSLQNLRNFYPGFNKENVLLLSIHPMTVGYADARAALLYRDLLDRMNRIPGVRSASFSFFSPLRGPVASVQPKIDGIAPLSAKETKAVAISEVGPDYFRTLETPILSGRDFNAADRSEAPKVSIINEAMTREYFGTENPIGRHLSLNRGQNWFEIVGVVKETKNRDVRESPVPIAYLPLYQSPEGAVTFEVRTAINPLSLSDSIQRVIRATDSRIPIYDIKTLSEQVDDSLVQERLVASLSGLFGLLALILAAVGLYGLMTYATNRRTGEIGIRVAMGATRAQIAGMVLRETLLLVLIGLVIGIPAATALSYLIRSELYGLRADDPLTILIASFVMAGIAAFAGYFPARRASHVDPMVALRTE
jgi:predicted permease